MKKYYQYKDTNRIYSVEQENVKYKRKYSTFHTTFGEIEEEVIYEWEDGYIVYRAEYNNEDGPLFIREKEDFENNFHEIKLVYHHDEGININVNTFKYLIKSKQYLINTKVVGEKDVAEKLEIIRL